MLTSFPDIHQVQFPNDAKFLFSPSNLVLWGNVESLSAASPYFKTLFDSGFAEGSVSTPEERGAKSNRRNVERDFDYSDDETDEITLPSTPNLHPPSLLPLTTSRSDS